MGLNGVEMDLLSFFHFFVGWTTRYPIIKKGGMQICFIFYKSRNFSTQKNNINSPFLHYIPPTCRCAVLTIDGCRRALSQQSLELPHCIRHHKFRVALYQDVQLGVLPQLRHLACRIVTALGRDGRPGLLQHLCNVGPVCDRPARFLCCPGLAPPREKEAK